MSALARFEGRYLEQPARFETPNHHTDVVCPFNPDATCGRCAHPLRHHLPVGDDPKDLHGYLCPLNGFRAQRYFDPEDDEDLGCPVATDCSVCGVRICTDHSDGFTTCSYGVHHLSCAETCGECRDAYRGEW